MFRRARLAILGAVLTILATGVRAQDDGSIYEVSPGQLEEQWGESSIEELIAEDAIIEPDIDLAGGAFVSSIPQTAWSAGAEVVAFHPRYDGVDFSEDGDDTYTAAPRYFLGWESASGYGIRSRYWKQETEGNMPIYDYPLQVFPVPGPPLTIIGISNHNTYELPPVLLTDAAPGAALFYAPLYFEAESFDLDLYKRVDVRRTSLLFGAGLKTNEFGNGYSVPYETYGESVSTVGVSLFSDLNHVLYQTERGKLSLVASARMGFLSGEKSNTYAIHDLNGTIISDSTHGREIDMIVSEGAIGPEWQRDFGWSVLVLRGQYETQLWNTDGSDDVAFSGGAMRVGLSW